MNTQNEWEPSSESILRRRQLAELATAASAQVSIGRYSTALGLSETEVTRSPNTHGG